jgi:hypothetical protein
VPGKPPKLVLAVVDGLKPAMLERAVNTGRAPAMQAVMDRGTYVDECCAAFPSVTPVCAASIATGTRQDRHRIPSMNWYHRDERRYVEYGSSFSASRRFGIARQLTDTVFNMNAEHLPADVPTVFESLDDADVRTAGTTYLIYRGRHEHQISRETALTRLASSTTCSTSCCCRCPTTTRTRTRTARTPRCSRSRTPIGSSSGCSMPAAAPTRSSTSMP